MPHTPETQKDYEETLYAKYWAIAQTKHFGVTFEPKDKDQPFPRSENFSKWYRFWHNYIEGLPKETWKKLDSAFANKEDLTPYWPAKTWIEE